METKEYIEYLRSFKIKDLNETIELFQKNSIDFGVLERKALDNDLLSIRCYFKTFKIGNILNKMKKG